MNKYRTILILGAALALIGGQILTAQAAEVETVEMPSDIATGCDVEMAFVIALAETAQLSFALDVLPEVGPAQRPVASIEIGIPIRPALVWEVRPFARPVNFAQAPPKYVVV